MDELSKLWNPSTSLLVGLLSLNFNLEPPESEKILKKTIFIGDHDYDFNDDDPTINNDDTFNVIVVVLIFSSIEL